MLELSADQRSLIATVVKESRALQMPVFLVGGVVRDLLLGYSAQDKDFDFIVVGNAERLARACAERIGGEVKVFASFLTAKIVGPLHISSLSEVDFATARRERYEAPGMLPKVEPASSIREDVARRDFSVNAIAVRLDRVLELVESGQLNKERLVVDAVDEFGGVTDLEARRLRILHAQSFYDDPTRIFRAARYVTRLEGGLEESTASALQAAVQSGALGTVSWPRIGNELRKVAGERHWADAFRALVSWKVFESLGLRAVDSEVQCWSGLQKRLDRVGLLPEEAIFRAFVASLLPDSTEVTSSILGRMNISKALKKGLLSLVLQRQEGAAPAGVRAEETLDAQRLAGYLIDLAGGRVSEERVHDLLTSKNL